MLLGCAIGAFFAGSWADRWGRPAVLPESPRYLVVNGRREAALAVLTKLYGPREAQAKLAEISAWLAGPAQVEAVEPGRQGHRQGVPDRVDRHRHQRGVLLRCGAVAGGGLLRKRRAADQRAVAR